MRVTATQLPDGLGELEEAWAKLVAHWRDSGPHLVVLPELIFAPWLFVDRSDQAAWERAASDHRRWLERLRELTAGAVVGSRPVVRRGANYNEAFVWSADSGLHAIHRKHYLPDEDGFREARWYQRGAAGFDVAQTEVGCVGVLLCTELWFTEHARSYAHQGVEVPAVPRATERGSLEQWTVAGRAAALLSGAFCVSSNRAGSTAGIDWAGGAFIIAPPERCWP